METASEAILSLRPVTFHYKTDTKGTPQFGLIAEEVAKVNPDLGGARQRRKSYRVRYDAGERDVAQRVPQRAPQKRRTRGDDRAARKRDSAEQEKQIEALTAGLEKVSDRA